MTCWERDPIQRPEREDKDGKPILISKPPSRTQRGLDTQCDRDSHTWSPPLHRCPLSEAPPTYMSVCRSLLEEVYIEWDHGLEVSRSVTGRSGVSGVSVFERGDRPRPSEIHRDASARHGGPPVSDPMRGPEKPVGPAAPRGPWTRYPTSLSNDHHSCGRTKAASGTVPWCAAEEIFPSTPTPRCLFR